ncbi:MAG: HAD family hydrolase [Archaeoglobaceae archaeon]
MTVKGIIYDMDDLLVDSHRLHVRSVEAVIEQYGRTINDIPQWLWSESMGKRLIDFLHDLVKVLDLKESVETLNQRRSEVFLKLVEEELQPLPGALESLDLLNNHFKIGLASSGTRKYLEMVVDRFDIRKCFQVIVSGDEVEYGKPHPEVYLTASRKLGLNANECLVFEDATHGIRSAKEAGCKCIGVKNPNTPPQDLSEADMVLNSLEELTIDMVNSFQA